jgi:hypothetical protein
VDVQCSLPSPPINNTVAVDFVPTHKIGNRSTSKIALACYRRRDMIKAASGDHAPH